MRTIPFKNILWAVAYKLGLDPKQSAFQNDQALSIAGYANEWVRRVYPSKDFPEWTFVEPFIPVNHVVTYVQDDILKIDNVFEVYLVDPATTVNPVETDYELTPFGIHCGFNHGTNVWIRYQGPTPEYTAEAWDNLITYEKGDLTYSPIVGECFESRTSGNQGNDPARGTIVGNIVQTVQPFIAPQPGVPAQTKIMDLIFPSAGNPPPNGTLYAFKVRAQDGLTPPYVTIAYTADGIKTFPTVLAEILTLCGSALNPLGFVVIAPIPPGNKLQFSHLSEFNITDSHVQVGGGGPDLSFVLNQIQSYLPPIAAVSGQPQIIAVRLSTGAQVQPDAVYHLELLDSSGVSHPVSYTALAHDATPQVLTGLIAAIDGSNDPFLQQIGTSLEDNGFTLKLSIMQSFSANFSAIIENQWWDPVLFPIEIANEVIMGVYSDTKKEWGQTEEGMAERQTALAEADTTPSTVQQPGKSRYGI